MINGSLFTIEEMTAEAAQNVASWTYEPPFELYSMNGADDLVTDLMQKDYYIVASSEVPYFGYFCLGEEGRVPGGYAAGIYDDTKDVVDLGLGMHPDWTGQGYSSPFISRILHWIQENRSVSRVRLVVAVFNERAIRAYERNGFVRGDLFFTKVGKMDLPFVVMTAVLTKSSS